MPIPENVENLRRVSAKSSIYQVVCSWIITGVLKPGEKIVDSELAKRFNVSRTPVREAIQILEGQKLVYVVPGLMPYFIRRSAGAYYDANKERMIAKNLLFTDHTVQIKTGRYEAHLDYGLLFRAYEDKKMFLLYTGEEESHFVPKCGSARSPATKI